ncbi:hypothetical protein GCM10009118_00680 [Wandonia haliotis]|uniref:CobW C-terminal domain-containing protein n=1 Tax=Wandonia haliotis TaxID=574963 RepID=A0ABN1MKE8_9FLAO
MGEYALRRKNTIASFLDYHEEIEKRWSKDFGDRLNELVFIGQDMDQQQILKQLESCICSPEEISLYLENQFPDGDEWPVAKI